VGTSIHKAATKMMVYENEDKEKNPNSYDASWSRKRKTSSDIDDSQDENLSEGEYD